MTQQSTHLIAYLTDCDHSQNNSRWFFRLPSGSITTLKSLEEQGWTLAGVCDDRYFFFVQPKTANDN